MGVKRKAPKKTAKKTAAKKAAQPGARNAGPKRAAKKSVPVTVETLRALRTQLGTKELARRMGIPAPSLRRLVGTGKGSGLPKQQPKWVSDPKTKQRKLVAGHAFHQLTQKIGAARQKPENLRRNSARRKALEAAKRGELDASYDDIADEYGLDAREVYEMAVSPKGVGVATV